MPSVESEGQAARQQLERVLSSSGFARNERLSGFLRFAVERHLEGRDEELKESVIAIEVFGRPPGHDSKKDPIVRTEAGRLRSRLAEYYLGEGKDDPLIIELPKGGYVPLLRAFGEPEVGGRPFKAKVCTSRLGCRHDRASSGSPRHTKLGGDSTRLHPSA